MDALFISASRFAFSFIVAPALGSAATPAKRGL